MSSRFNRYLKPMVTIVVVLFIAISVSAGFASSHPAGAAPANISISDLNSVNQGVNSSLTYRIPSSNGTLLNTGAGGNWTSTGKILSGKVENLAIPSQAKLLPNFYVSPVKSGSTYLPSYTSGPAPMGIGSYGILNKSGVLTPYTYSTSSFEGSLTISNASEFYMGSDSPHSFSIQMNAVLNNVTVQGKSGFQYWTQNVVDYTTSTHTLQFIDNIWNFSSPSAVINGNEFSSFNGTVVPGVFYYTVGPSFTVTFPFTINLYLNTTTSGNQTSVYFNYSISSSGFNGSGSYDRVQFNSGTQSSIQPAIFEVSGSKLTGTGYVPMDAEMDIVGPGAGSTANFQAINATMSLSFKNGSNGYEPVKSAYSVGSETGETSSGISEYFQGTTAYMNSGPSFVIPMWGISQNSGYLTVSGDIAPSNAFVFISNTTQIDNATAQWAPVGQNGQIMYRLPTGTYSMEVLLSYHEPVYINNLLSAGNTTVSANLIYNVSTGLYTPLYASNNTQLSYLKYSGSGTPSDPYILPGPGYLKSAGISIPYTLSQVFAQTNDYLYPTFNGIQISGTSDYALFDGFQSLSGGAVFGVQYPTSLLPYLTYNFGVTPGNNLNMVFYNSSHIILNDSVVSGWFSALVYSNFNTYNIPVVGSLMLWNTTSSLIEHNRFESEGSGALIYGPGTTDLNNTIWNNTFSNAPTIPAGAFYGGAPIGLSIAGSGNTVFNNAFTAIIPVVSIDGTYADIYNGSNVTYYNSFNITKTSASQSTQFDGVSLSGSILGLAYQSGNYYYNYFGNGSQSYNGTGVGYAFNGQGVFNGSINYGYDYSPIVKPGYSTNVSASYLPLLQTTYFDINNAIYSILPGRSTSLYLPNGTYELLGFILYNQQTEYLPQTMLGKANLTSGYFTVLGPILNLSLSYTEYYNVTISESGLANGTIWGFAVPGAGIGFTLTNSSQSLYLQGGTYVIYPQAVAGYYTSDIQLQVNSPLSATIYYSTSSGSGGHTVSLQVVFTENGLPAGVSWGVTILGQKFVTNDTSMTITGFSSGVYLYAVSAVSGYTTSSGGQLNLSGGNATVSLTFLKNPPGNSPYPYIAIGAVFGVFVGAVAVYFRLRK